MENAPNYMTCVELWKSGHAIIRLDTLMLVLYFSLSYSAMLRWPIARLEPVS